MVRSSLINSVRKYQSTGWIALLAIALSVGWFLLDGNVKVNIADEGFLWYGSQAVRRGEVPMRDFEAYDPGRYLWVAGWSYLLGEGDVALRLACVFFQCLGVFAGLLVVRRLSRHWLLLGCMGLLFCVWMHPRFKLFEQSIALMAVYAAVLLLERPTLRRHWWVGVFGGLCAYMGRNHGAYHVFSFGLVIIWAARTEGWRIWLRRTAIWVAGLLVGYLPQWLMFAFIPGYLQAYIPYLAAIFSSGTNLPKPVDWPWLINPQLPSLARLSAIIEGWFYVFLIAVPALTVVRAWLLGSKRLAAHPVLVAAFCVSLPYTHFVFSRPDIVHLSHAAPVAVLVALALLFTFPVKWDWIGKMAAAILLVASTLANLFQFNVTYEMVSPPNSLYTIPVKGERMITGSYYARLITSAHTLSTKIAKPDEAILFAPHMPWLYPFLGRRSPTKQIYFVFPAKPEADQALVAEIEAANVQWVMLQDYALDGKDSLRFRNTNPAVMDLFYKKFERIPMETLPRDTILLHRKVPVPLAP